MRKALPVLVAVTLGAAAQDRKAVSGAIAERAKLQVRPEVASSDLKRLAPILMTALATSLALLPIVLTGSKPGQEIEYPLAVVIVGGLLTSTLMNLLLSRRSICASALPTARTPAPDRHSRLLRRTTHAMRGPPLLKLAVLSDPHCARGSRLLPDHPRCS